MEERFHYSTARRHLRHVTSDFADAALTSADRNEAPTPAVSVLQLLFGFVLYYELHMEHPNLSHAYTHGNTVC